LTDPGGLAFEPDGNLYVNSGEGSGSQANAILRFVGTTGNFIDTFVPSGSGGLSGGLDLIFGPDGRFRRNPAVGSSDLKGRNPPFCDIAEGVHKS
jgi:hypothetical protein